MSNYKGSTRNTTISGKPLKTQEAYPSEIDPPTLEDLEMLMYAQDSTDLNIFREFNGFTDFRQRRYEC